MRGASRQQPIKPAKLPMFGRGLRGHCARSARPGAVAPVAWVTTKRFLEIFALESLRDLPDLETLEAGGLPRRNTTTDALTIAVL